MQARIPRQLDEELREHADQLGLSVSTVVRNVLLTTFELVEGVVADSTNLARVIQGRKPRALPHRGDAPAGSDNETGVVGWQEAVLNRNGICDECNAILHKGERAAVGSDGGDGHQPGHHHGEGFSIVVHDRNLGRRCDSAEGSECGRCGPDPR